MSLFAFSPLFNTKVLAITCDTGTSPAANNTICLPTQSQQGPQSVTALIIFIINILLSIAAVLAILFLVIGGYKYIFSNGNEEAAKGGRATVVNALIGIAIIILSFAIVGIVSRTVGGSNGFFGVF